MALNAKSDIAEYMGVNWSKERAQKEEILDYLKVPALVRLKLDLLNAVIVRRSTHGFALPELPTYVDWEIAIPIPRLGKSVRMPLPEVILDDGHWDAILAAAADFQHLCQSGQYQP